MTERKAWPKLEAPPIIEVACGVFFPGAAAPDPISVGGWWRQIKKGYPKHEIQPAVNDSPGFIIGIGSSPLRSWLISDDDEWIIQVQPDRFYVNWRKRRGSYPRFSGPGGVCERALFELNRFTTYCREELTIELSPSTIELAKVDAIVESRHWKEGNSEDLGRLLPIIADVGRFARSEAVELGLNLVERIADGTVQVNLSLSTEALFGGHIARTVKVETRCVRSLPGQSEAQLKDAFAKANSDANSAFFGLISNDELERFQKEAK